MRLSSLVPSSMGRWNALRPEISPIPPARLFTTAVFTASAKSLSPEAPPELSEQADHVVEGPDGLRALLHEL